MDQGARAVEAGSVSGTDGAAAAWGTFENFWGSLSQALSRQCPGRRESLGKARQ